MSDSKNTPELKGPIYGVPWTEVEYGWGDRPEGWALFTDLDTCRNVTKEASDKGSYEGGYIGPERPLRYFEIPVEGLDEEYQKTLLEKSRAHTSNYWSPRFKSASKGIS